MQKTMNAANANLATASTGIFIAVILAEFSGEQ